MRFFNLTHSRNLFEEGIFVGDLCHSIDGIHGEQNHRHNDDIAKQAYNKPKETNFWGYINSLIKTYFIRTSIFA